MELRETVLRQLKNRREGFSLEQPFYTDPDYFKLDMETIWYRDWLFVGHDCEVAKSGSYFTVQIGAYSVVIVRGRDGQIRAFHNSCRHRGSRVCTTQKGQSARLVCPYHQWTYDLDGKLLFARHMGEEFDKGDFGLKPVACETVAGYVFICLADQPADFAPMRAEVESYMAPHRIWEAKVAHESTIIEKGNWKLVWENNRECYHCAANHPELCRTYPENPSVTGTDGGASDPEIGGHWARCEAAGLPSRFKIDPKGQFRVARMPLIGEAESYTMSGKRAVRRPLSDDVSISHIGALLLFHYPTTWNHFLGDHTISFRVLPLSANETMVTTKWLVHKDAVEGVDYDLEDLTHVWNETNDQDRRIVEENAFGIRSPAYEPGPYSMEDEGGVMQFVNWYADFMVDRLSGDKARLSAVARDAKMNMVVSYKHIDEMKPWSDKLHLLECISVTPETPDVMTFLFRSEDQNWFRYLPGQFVTLELPVGKEPLYRTYTLSSSPSRPYALSVTVKAQANSIGTRWMFDNLKPGMKIRALGPLGDFSYVKHPGDKYLFISAGSGVTPMMSMVRDMSDRAPQSDIAFINCSRTPGDIVFRHELEYLARFMPNLSLGFIVEKCGRTDLWSGLKGMVDKAKIALLAHDFMERTVFCCGPEPFMAAVRSMLEASGFDMGRYHQESFSPATPVAVGESVLVDADGEALSMVGFTVSGKEMPCQPGQTVLMTARAAGVRIGAACESGICGTCRVLKLSGEVEMNHNGGILDEEIEEGYILACCSRPLTDVKVEA